MISVVFLVCNLMSGECYTISEPQLLFKTNEECHTYAKDLIVTQNDRVLKGDLEPFQAEYQCISWSKA
jgi:hypothetical protein